MKRFGFFLVWALSMAIAFPALAGSHSGSLNVSVVVLPSKEARVNAPAPTNGFQRMENLTGEHWVVEASAEQALASYRTELAAAGFHPVDATAMRWQKGDLSIMISAQDAISSSPISRLDALAFRAPASRYDGIQVAQVGSALASVN